MKILLTGATGYIARKLLPVLLTKNYEVVCCTRDLTKFPVPLHVSPHLHVIEVDFLVPATLSNIPKDIDVAYYLIHSMTSSIDDFEEMEMRAAHHFRDYIETTTVQQVIYLSGIQNDKKLSRHLLSRQHVEKILAGGAYNLTTLRAGIIVGSGSASFEIIRDLVEKLPIMVAPRWVETRSQPIAIHNVIQYLLGVVLHTYTYNRSFDIGGPEILTYRDMLIRYAHYRSLRRKIWTVPLLTPRISSFWLYFLSSTSYKLAANLVNSMRVEVICKENELKKILNIQPIRYEDAVRMAFDKIEQQEVIPYWRSMLYTINAAKELSFWIQPPSFGCYADTTKRKFVNKERTIENIWNIGGQNGWYLNWLWTIRGVTDKALGGHGFPRGRGELATIASGDAIDFWEVLYANKEEGRLLLYTEMKYSGEAWLDYSIHKDTLYQKASFRPWGIWGRLYWNMVKPFHAIVFKGMLKKLTDTLPH